MEEEKAVGIKKADQRGSSSSEEDNPEVYIEKGHWRECFSQEEVSDAKVVQKRFFLEKEPLCVFSARTGKRVAFRKLKPGIIYMLKEEEKDIYIEKDDWRLEL